jgi:hypothetical protein
MFKGGEVELCHSIIVTAAALGRHSAGDLSSFHHLPVGRCPLLAPLIGVDQELARFDLTVPQNPVEGLKHQGGLYGGANGPTDHAEDVQVDSDMV